MSDRKDEKIRCDACPVMCYIADGKSGACDRYANHDGQIVRLDPLTILDRRMAAGDSVKPFRCSRSQWTPVSRRNASASALPSAAARCAGAKPRVSSASTSPSNS